MASILKEKWLWIVIALMICIVVVPIIVIIAILYLPPILKLASMILVVVAWGVAAAYRDWVKAQREEEEKMGKTGSKLSE